ncbi:hypothetical protein [Streptomyces sp. A012304]|uniref:hypothetical protein n=1 Tax=Streptomyces sp. A012304 TaxID=375446 RepID=UPI00222F8BF4|nr:hypothetical protein [Streptomyces sp. A012304]GKQ35440.1 hypothetical protein ALMP_19830 [Streptomyces sp. A012304]
MRKTMKVGAASTLAAVAILAGSASAASATEGDHRFGGDEPGISIVNENTNTNANTNENTATATATVTLPADDGLAAAPAPAPAGFAEGFVAGQQAGGGGLLSVLGLL